MSGGGITFITLDRASLSRCALRGVGHDMLTHSHTARRRPSHRHAPLACASGGWGGDQWYRISTIEAEDWGEGGGPVLVRLAGRAVLVRDGSPRETAD